MLLGLFIWSLPWYALSFALLAFLPRWHWLLAGGLLALVFSLYQFDVLARQDSPGAGIGVIIMLFVSVGFTSGFLARSLVLIGKAINWRLSRPVVVLPFAFAAGIASFLSYSAL